MQNRQCLAMLLAGGQGSRLGNLTRKLAKPAVPFGGKYRIIDFALSNCYNSGFETVGVLTQYKPLALNTYIGIGSAWDLDRKSGGVFVLPPYVREQGGEWYKGTADAICQNVNFIDFIAPEYVLILSGDHIYKMDYSIMLEYHRSKGADATIAVLAVPWEEASRFGIMSTDEHQQIVEFAEKPAQPKSNLASMGIYIFNWQVLRQFLIADSKDRNSTHDFGKDVIPAMLNSGQKMFAYPFSGYWKDVGTIASYWEANMDLLCDNSELNIYDSTWRIYSVNPSRPPHYVAAEADIKRSIVSEGCQIFGEVEHSVIFPDVYIGPGAKVKDSIIMSRVRIEANAVVEKAIISRRSVVNEYAKVAAVKDGEQQEIVVIPDATVIPANTAVSESLPVLVDDEFDEMGR